MRIACLVLPLLSVLLLTSCSNEGKREMPSATAEPPKTEPEPAASAAGPHAFVRLNNGSNVPGVIVASSKTDMVVAGDDGIEHKIPLGQIKSVQYGDTESGTPTRHNAPVRPVSPPATMTPPQDKAPAKNPQQRAPAETRIDSVPAVSTKTYELPSGSEISVRVNEPVDSETAAEGQTFDAQVTRDATDAAGDVVIPRRSTARVVIKSASRGGRFRGASDLILDLQSVTLNGKDYTIETVDVTKRGNSGVGANRRTAEYTGGGAALGAIIGAIAGGGKGAAIGAGAGAGAGALTQVLTKGRAIKVPAESVLTFNLDKPLRIVTQE